MPALLGAVNVVEAAVTVLDVNAPLSSVTLCGASSAFANVTVAPAATVSGGPNLKSFAVMVEAIVLLLDFADGDELPAAEAEADEADVAGVADVLPADEQAESSTAAPVAARRVPRRITLGLMEFSL
ncbi:MAG: hypothetical protein ABJB98_10660 [Actinomycetota bacterium]